METLLSDEGIEVTAETTDDELDEIEPRLALGAEASNTASIVVI